MYAQCLQGELSRAQERGEQPGVQRHELPSGLPGMEQIDALKRQQLMRATNLLTGLWDAKMDRAPVLALSGQVGSQVLGPGAFQEVDLASAFSAVTAWSQTVQAGSNHAELMNLAIKMRAMELIFHNLRSVLNERQISA